jgi:arylsulfatase A-like enzyme
MKSPSFYLTIIMLSLFVLSCTEEPPKKPNIIVIYADDLGYGDVSFNGASEIQTTNLDKLAKGGVTFTDGYATSATCTPSRYALLTGQYPWRRKEAKILPGTASTLHRD